MISSSSICAAVRPLLRCGVAATALLFAMQAGAQVAEPVGDPSTGTTSQTPEAAQDTPDAGRPLDPGGRAAEDSSQIIVTGTLVRGIAPAGTNVIGVTQAEIQATGSTTTAQLLQTIPQLGSFNQLQFPAGFGNTVTVNRPNLRSLPGFNTAAGSTTLVLMDGHRIVGAGVTSTSPDPDIIPPGAIARLEIVPDGGSAIYGSDAVAGVLNFITLKRFDGVKLAAHYGFADDYHQADINATVGKDWGTGSAYVSYNYAEHGAIFGRDRDYIQQFADPANGRLNVQCGPGSVQIGTPPIFYDLPYTTATAVGRAAPLNQCDSSDDASFYPSEKRHSVFAGISQDFGAVTADLRAFYTAREITISNGPFRQSSSVSGTTINNFFPTRRVGAETTQTVNYAFGDPADNTQRINLETWGVTPTLTADLGGGWQGRLLGSYSTSDTNSRAAAINTTALGNAINAGLFDPYNPSASNPAAVGIILNQQNYGHTRQRLADIRAIVDGELFQLPGGGVKVAVGGEYYRENFRIRQGNAVPGSALTGAPAQSVGATLLAPAFAPLRAIALKRNVKSAFGELVVPIFGTDNATTLFQELTVSAAGRYDKYSDVGDTFNPKFGITWRPVSWVKLRGAYGKSFNAPSLADGPTADLTTVFLLPGGLPEPALRAPNGPYPVPTAAQTHTVAVRGNSPGIGPQTAKTFSLGVDLEPPFIPGLNLSLTYFKIDLKGVIGLPPAQNGQLVYRDFPQLITLNPSAADITALIATASPGATILFPCSDGTLTSCVYAIRDIRKRNLGNFKLDGLDFNGSYDVKTGFGSLNFAVNANYELNRKQAASATAAFVDVLSANTSRFKFRATAGAEIGNFLGQVTFNHTQGYDLQPNVGFVGTDVLGRVFTTQQDRVGDFNVVNLFFRYDVPGEGLLKGLQFTLNVDNLFDQDPPFFRGSQTPNNGVINGNTLGRLIQFGVSKRF